jgi:transcriptional regulator with XRE-family HTH domain
VRAARGWAGLSQTELADALNVNVATVRRIEQEQRNAGTAELLHIGEVCDVPRHFMLHGWSGYKASSRSDSETRDSIVADMAKRIERLEQHERDFASDRLAKAGKGPDLLNDLDTALPSKPSRRGARPARRSKAT